MTTTSLPRLSVTSTCSLDDPAGSRSVHPLGSKAKVLLCSVFGPYAQDDEYGSRVINPMELWHNQITRVQGPFSLRMFHRSWGLMLMQANMEARCTCLDFATRDRFIEEIRDNPYDIIGISAIVPTLPKAAEMCRLIREHAPAATIVVGGHIAGLPDVAERLDADHIVRGDGVEWFRRFLGEDVDKPIRHPRILAGFQRRTMGLSLPASPRKAAAALIPAVGCPMGCNFCATSAMFGGKGHSVEFFPEGEDLFAVMCDLEQSLKVNSFFIMDENFLLQRPRALKLLELMRKHKKAWSLYVFSSANAIRKYTMDELVALGVSWLWLGLEGKNSQYGKLNNTDSRDLVRQLQDHGIRVLGSSIIGMEDHTPENIDEAIAHAVSHDADFHQFMLYTAVAGTPLYEEHRTRGTLLGPEELPFEDSHGQYKFNYRHEHIRDGQETEYLLRAFNEDFRVNGPSILRLYRTTLKGRKKYRRHPERRVRKRFAYDAEGIGTFYPGTLWASRRWFRDNPALTAKIEEMHKDICREFGLVARLAAPLLGRFLLWRLHREARRLDAGMTYEPPTFCEHNYVEAGTKAVGAKR